MRKGGANSPFWLQWQHDRRLRELQMAQMRQGMELQKRLGEQMLAQAPSIDTVRGDENIYEFTRRQLN